MMHRVAVFERETREREWKSVYARSTTGVLSVGLAPRANNRPTSRFIIIVEGKRCSSQRF